MRNHTGAMRFAMAAGRGGGRVNFAGPTTSIARATGRCRCLCGFVARWSGCSFAKPNFERRREPSRPEGGERSPPGSTRAPTVDAVFVSSVGSSLPSDRGANDCLSARSSKLAGQSVLNIAS